MREHRNSSAYADEISIGLVNATHIARQLTSNTSHHFLNITNVKEGTNLGFANKLQLGQNKGT